MPPPLKWALRPLLQRYYPVTEDRRTVPTVNDVTGYLMRFGLLPGMDEANIRATLNDVPATIEIADPPHPPAHTDKPAHIPAQWQPTERIIVTWPVNFPPLWEMHAQIVEAITPVADVQININHPMWAQAVRLYLAQRGEAHLARVLFYHLPTDDIWVRDYGPIVGVDDAGKRVAVNMIYDPLPNYPQERDDAMPERWAAHENIPVNKLELRGEGGNMWSDGAGTLLMTNQVYRQNPDIRRDELLTRLHGAFTFKKLVLLPRLRLEETGHVDLLVKLANVNTALVSAPDAQFTGDRLRAATKQLRRETNARGQRYDVVVLPTPPLYVNWFGFPIRRSYTNALTVNGRVLVPVYGVETDNRALRTYEVAMPDHDIIPIDCIIGANGGGAVHCLTKEVPRT